MNRGAAHFLAGNEPDCWGGNNVCRSTHLALHGEYPITGNNGPLGDGACILRGKEIGALYCSRFKSNAYKLGVTPNK